MKYDTSWKLSSEYPGYLERVSTMVILSPISEHNRIAYRMEHGMGEWTYRIRDDMVQNTQDWYDDGSITIGCVHYVRMVAPTGQQQHADATIWVEVSIKGKKPELSHDHDALVF